MATDYASLLETLNKQIKLYKRLLALALEKQPVLIKGKIPELDEITKEEELIILQVGRLEEERQALHQALANQLVLSPENLTLSELISRSGPDIGSKYKNTFKELTKVLEDLAEINQANTELIKTSLDYVNFSLNLLVNDDTAPSYAENEEQKRQAPAKIFDRKI